MAKVSSNKFWSLLLLVSMMALLMAGPVFAQGVSNVDVVWIGKTLNNPWWIQVGDLAKREAAELGVNLTTYLPEEEVDLEKQVAMIAAAVQQGADAIVISATSSEGVIPALEEAKEAGIVVVNFDTRVADPSLRDAFVGADDELGAYKAGKYIAERLGGRGKVALLEGLLAQSTGVDRKNGFLRAIAEYPDIQVVASAPAEWRSDLALDATINILTAHPDVDAIFASNDQMAVGMVNGVYAAGRSPDDFILVGYDGILDAAKMVLDDELDAFVALPARDEGRMGIRLAVAALNNPDFEFPREIILPTPLVTGDLTELTEETIEEYIARVFPLYRVNNKGY